MSQADLCPIRRKRRHFNQPWAQIAAEEQGGACEPYLCMCGWWHIRSVAKRKQRKAAYKARRQRWRRRQDFLAFEVWEGEGGALFHVKHRGEP